MDRNRLWLIGLVAVMVAVVALGWLLGIQPQLAATAAADQNRATVQSENAANEVVLAKLKKDYSSIGELKQRLVSLRQSVPASADMSAFVTELDTLAGAHQVTVKTITVSDAVPYTAPIAPAAAPTATASPATTPTPAPIAAAPTAPTAPPAVTNSKITAANFIAIPIQLSLAGAYSNVLDFVNGLQMGPRLFLVTTFSTSASSATAGAGAVDATVGGFVYVVLDANAAAAKAATPTPTPTPKPKSTPKSTSTPTPTSPSTPTTTPTP
jgi:Tfp pilus assembly protein PilO